MRLAEPSADSTDRAVRLLVQGGKINLRQKNLRAYDVYFIVLLVAQAV
jgi:hypothetical protein